MSRKGEGNNQVVVNVEIYRHGGIESTFGDEFSYGPVRRLLKIKSLFCYPTHRRKLSFNVKSILICNIVNL